jgi:hypothetical protein
MKEMKEWLYRAGIGLAGVVLIALVVILFAPKTAHAVLSALVTVSNTAANPVPVTGAVSVAGTPTVNVASMPTLTVDPVSLSGNVPVVNPLDTSNDPVSLITNQAPLRWDPTFNCFSGCQQFQLTVPKAPNGSDQAYEVQYISGLCDSLPSPLPSNGVVIRISSSEPFSATRSGSVPEILIGMSVTGNALFFSQRVDFFTSSIGPMTFSLNAPEVGPLSSGTCSVTLNGRLFPETQR